MKDTRALLRFAHAARTVKQATHKVVVLNNVVNALRAAVTDKYQEERKREREKAALIASLRSWAGGDAGVLITECFKAWHDSATHSREQKAAEDFWGELRSDTKKRDSLSRQISGESESTDQGEMLAARREKRTSTTGSKHERRTERIPTGEMKEMVIGMEDQIRAHFESLSAVSDSLEESEARCQGISQQLNRQVEKARKLTANFDLSRLQKLLAEQKEPQEALESKDSNDSEATTSERPSLSHEKIVAHNCEYLGLLAKTTENAEELTDDEKARNETEQYRRKILGSLAGGEGSYARIIEWKEDMSTLMACKTERGDCRTSSKGSTESTTVPSQGMGSVYGSLSDVDNFSRRESKESGRPDGEVDILPPVASLPYESSDDGFSPDSSQDYSVVHGSEAESAMAFTKRTGYVIKKTDEIDGESESEAETAIHSAMPTLMSISVPTMTSLDLNVKPPGEEEQLKPDIAEEPDTSMWKSPEDLPQLSPRLPRSLLERRTFKIGSVQVVSPQLSPRHADLCAQQTAGADASGYPRGGSEMDHATDRNSRHNDKVSMETLSQQERFLLAGVLAEDGVDMRTIQRHCFPDVGQPTSYPSDESPKRVLVSPPASTVASVTDLAKPLFDTMSSLGTVIRSSRRAKSMKSWTNLKVDTSSGCNMMQIPPNMLPQIRSPSKTAQSPKSGRFRGVLAGRSAFDVSPRG
jgi:hypothetical protein